MFGSARLPYAALDNDQGGRTVVPEESTSRKRNKGTGYAATLRQDLRAIFTPPSRKW